MTIYALASGSGASGIAVIRVSGKNTTNVIKSLTNSADQIPEFSIIKQKNVIGKNTIEALRSGFYWGYTGLINNIILKIENETKKKYKVIFTGGYADLFKTSIQRSFAIDTNITISGIIEIFKKNKNYLIK